MKFVVILWL